MINRQRQSTAYDEWIGRCEETIKAFLLASNIEVDTVAGEKARNHTPSARNNHPSARINNPSARNYPPSARNYPPTAGTIPRLLALSPVCSLYPLLLTTHPAPLAAVPQQSLHLGEVVVAVATRHQEGCISVDIMRLAVVMITDEKLHQDHCRL